MSMKIALPLYLAVTGLGLQAAAAAEPPKLVQGQPFHLSDGKPITDDAGNPSHDVSGIACLPPGAPRRLCVVIDDQGKDAQVVMLSNDTLEAGARIPLIGDKEAKGIVGALPEKPACSDVGRFKDLDGEAVAYAEPFFYVVGSHGCSRSSNKFRASSFILARFRLDAAGALLKPDGTKLPAQADPSEAVETTYRLGDALAADATLGSYFTAPLESDPNKDGMNIEGLAVTGDTLYAGLRAPSLDNKAFVVPVSVGALFAPGAGHLAATLPVIPLALDRKAGIRDMAPLPDGRFAILTGPTVEDPRTPFAIWAAHFDTKAIEIIGTLDDSFFDDHGQRKRAKAEALLPLTTDGKAFSALVLFDGPESGAPTEYHTAPSN